MPIKDNLRVGRPDTDPESPSHVRGVSRGNEPGAYEKMPGHRPDGRSTAERSTGVNPRSKNAILPQMPNISPP